MAEEEVEQLCDEEALTASLASEEHPEDQPEMEEEEEEEYVGEAPGVAQPEVVESEEGTEEKEVPEEQKDGESDGEKHDEEEIPVENDHEVAQPEQVDVPEEVDQPDQAVEKEEISDQNREGSDADDDEIRELTAEEVPTSERQSRGKTTATIPSRTNPGLRAKGVSTPIVPIFTSSRKESPKVVVSWENDKKWEGGQAEEEASPTSQAEHPAQSTTDPAEPNESNMNEDEGESKAGSGEKSPLPEKPDEELVIEGPRAGGEAPEDDAAEETAAEEEAARKRERKGKAKVIPQMKVKKEIRMTGRTGGPKIRKPKEHMVTESSDSSGEEDDQQESYDVYPTVISEDIMDD